VVRKVVVHEHMGDPAGYAISRDDEGRFRVVRLSDTALVGRFATRVEALAAAEADRGVPPG
jgi:hypothetical protein